LVLIHHQFGDYLLLYQFQQFQLEQLQFQRRLRYSAKLIYPHGPSKAVRV
jgi:hypothetical protein